MLDVISHLRNADWKLNEMSFYANEDDWSEADKYWWDAEWLEIWTLLERG